MHTIYPRMYILYVKVYTLTCAMRENTLAVWVPIIDVTRIFKTQRGRLINPKKFYLLVSI